MANRPSITSMWAQFTAIYGDGKVASVGTKIGGKVGENIALGAKDPKLGFTNACAIRMSYALNNAGVPITRGPWNTSSGADKKWYIYRVKDLLTFLTQKFGKADMVLKNPTPQDFANVKGILVFNVSWQDASGHVTLWDGTSCSDHCYFPVASEASLWLLK